MVAKVDELEGKRVFSSDGGDVGEVAAVFLDNDTKKPEWLALRRGALGGKQVLVPAAEATVRRGGISVPFSESQIESAPVVAGNRVSQETERELASHYGVRYSRARSETGLAEGPQGRRGSGDSSRERRRSSGYERTRDELYAEAKRLRVEGRSKMKKRELERAVERARGRSGGKQGKANPIEVQRFLEGVNYPTRKGDLVREAERQGAHEDVRSTLARIRDEKFDSPADVSEAIGRLS
jgi:sporulation protein YlmC with PRC-barrel domain